jgi:hypothetical protein
MRSIPVDSIGIYARGQHKTAARQCRWEVHRAIPLQEVLLLQRRDPIQVARQSGGKVAGHVVHRSVAP